MNTSQQQQTPPSDPTDHDVIRITDLLSSSSEIDQPITTQPPKTPLINDHSQQTDLLSPLSSDFWECDDMSDDGEIDQGCIARYGDVEDELDDSHVAVSMEDFVCDDDDDEDEDGYGDLDNTEETPINESQHRDNNSTTILKSIETLFTDIMNQLIDYGTKVTPGPSFTVPSHKRTRKKSQYNPDDTTSSLKTLSFTTRPRSFAIYVRVLSIIHSLVLSNTRATKRDIYYRDVALFGSQRVVDEAVEDLSLWLRIDRHCLHVDASLKGLMAGPFMIELSEGRIMDIGDMGGGEGCIIPLVNDIRSVDCGDCNAIIVIEKEASFREVLSYRDKNRHRWVIITGKGYSDLNTRQFLHLLSTQTRLPIIFFVDNDPYGLDILLNYYNSTMNNIALQNTCQGRIHYGGLKCEDWKLSDTDKLLPLAEQDRKKAYQMIAKPVMHTESMKSYRTELLKMLFYGKKAELQILHDGTANKLGQEYTTTSPFVAFIHQKVSALV